MQKENQLPPPGANDYLQAFDRADLAIQFISNYVLPHKVIRSHKELMLLCEAALKNLQDVYDGIIAAIPDK